MTITLEIPPEVEANLSTQATARGLSLDAYLKTLIEERAGIRRQEHEQLAPEEWEKGLDELLDSVAVPEGVNEEAFHRENWYR